MHPYQNQTLPWQRWKSQEFPHIPGEWFRFQNDSISLLSFAPFNTPVERPGGDENFHSSWGTLCMWETWGETTYSSLKARKPREPHLIYNSTWQLPTSFSLSPGLGQNTGFFLCLSLYENSPQIHLSLLVIGIFLFFYTSHTLGSGVFLDHPMKLTFPTTCSFWSLLCISTSLYCAPY